MKKLCFLFAALLIAGVGFAQQNTFSKVYYDLAGEVQAYDAVPAFDHNYLVVGTRDQNGLVMKIDFAGDILWCKKIGDDNMTELNRIIATSDSNYLMLGQCKNSVLNDHDVFCIKINSAGDTLWSKSVDIGADEYAKSIQMTYDKGFIISGISYQAAVTPYSLMFVIKLDSAGNPVWSKKIAGGNWENQAYSVKQLPDSGFAVMGYTENQVGSNFEGKACLIKLLSDGTFSWAKSISPSFNWGYDLAVTPTGIFCFLGFQGGMGVVFAKTDFSGNLMWSTRNYVYVDGAYINKPGPQLSATSDGGFLYCAGGMFSPGNVVKIDSSGTPVWSKFIFTFVSRAVEIQDSGTMLVGNGPVYGVKTYPTYNPQIGIITLDSATNSVAPCMYDNFTTVDVSGISLTAISFSTAAGGTLVARHPLVADFTPDTYDGCVAFMGSIEENPAPGISANPNPASNTLNVETENDLENAELSMYDVHGRLVLQQAMPAPAVRLDISRLSPGLYIIKLLTGQGVGVKKFVKE
jgi:hypothetical protein